jgi:pimeloyl-ACP methyl ester carboxylesterase
MAAARSRRVAFIVSVSGSGVSPAAQQVYGVEAQSRAARFSSAELAKAGVLARALVDWQLTRPLYREQSRALLGRLGPGPWRAFATLVYEPGNITAADSLRRGIAILKSIRAESWATYLYLATAVLPALEAIPPARVAAARKAAEKSLLVDPRTSLRKVRCPVLGIWGVDDVLVPARESAAVYRTSLEAAGNDDVTLVVFANAGHSIDEFAPRYWRTLTGWLRERFEV